VGRDQEDLMTRGLLAKCKTLRADVNRMQATWSAHKRTCVIGAVDLAVEKQELFKGCGVFIDKQLQKEIREKKGVIS